MRKAQIFAEGAGFSLDRTAFNVITSQYFVCKIYLNHAYTD